MQPKSAEITWVHGLPKTHKNYKQLPKHRPIIYASSTPHCVISKVLSNLLIPLPEKEYVVQDSFFGAKKVREIPKEVFEDGYRFVSIDVEFLFYEYTFE